MVFKKGHKIRNTGKTYFKVGNTPWNRGKKMTKETREKISESRKGKLAWNKGLTKEDDARMMNLSNALKGHKLSKETIEKIRKKQIGMKKKQWSKTRRFKIEQQFLSNLNMGMKGKKHKKETIDKIKKARGRQLFQLRDSTIEIKIQNFLSQLHVEFYTHKYISEITHSYQCDIFIPKQEGINQKIIIECDGCYWHGCSICNKSFNKSQLNQIKEDTIRNKELREKGFRIIRLWEHKIRKINLKDLKISIIEPEAMIDREAKKYVNKKESVFPI